MGLFLTGGVGGAGTVGVGGAWMGVEVVAFEVVSKILRLLEMVALVVEIVVELASVARWTLVSFYSVLLY